MSVPACVRGSPVGVDDRNDPKIDAARRAALEALRDRDSGGLVAVDAADHEQRVPTGSPTSIASIGRPSSERPSMTTRPTLAAVVACPEHATVASSARTETTTAVAPVLLMLGA